MASGKAILGGMLGRFLFREARVGRVRELSPLPVDEVGGEYCRRRVVSWRQGQVFLPGIGMRTYTAGLGPDAGVAVPRLPAWQQPRRPVGAAPSSWVTVAPNCSARATPRAPLDSSRSLSSSSAMRRPYAVAHTLKAAKRSHSTDISQCSGSPPPTVTRGPLPRWTLADASIMERLPGDAHLAQGRESKLRTALQQHGRANLVLTGALQSSQALQARLRTSPIPSYTEGEALLVRGRVGLD